jgi:hypothetical protein
MLRKSELNVLEILRDESSGSMEAPAHTHPATVGYDE